MTLKEALRTSALRNAWPWIFATFPVIVLFEVQAISPIGHWSLLFFETFFLFPLLIAPFAIIILPLVAIRRSLRSVAFAWWLAAITYLPLAASAILVSQQIRRWGFERMAVRSAPLVSAISNYTDRYGRPPASLTALVPEFLPAVPKTGVMAYPRYEYYVGEDARRYETNPWVLVVRTPHGGINFDQFMYFPLKNYPLRGYGGSLERICDWAYVHE